MRSLLTYLKVREGLPVFVIIGIKNKFNKFCAMREVTICNIILPIKCPLSELSAFNNIQRLKLQ
jgi:hypothetical protein